METDPLGPHVARIVERLHFDGPAETADDVRRAMIELLRKARAA